MKTLRIILEDAAYDKQKSTIDSLSAHYKNYSDKDREHLHAFTTNSYHTNNALWTGKHEGHENDIGGLTSATNRHTTPHEFTAWSKTLNDPREMKNAQGVVHHPGFLSTSLMKSTAEHYLEKRNMVSKGGVTHHHVLEVKVPKGAPGAFIHDEDSINPRYKEFVIPHHSNLKYLDTNTRIIDAGKSSETHRHTHFMELMK